MSNRAPKRKRNHKKSPTVVPEVDEVEETELLESWIDWGKPNSGTNPLASSVTEDGPVGRAGDSFSPFVGCTRFDRLPISQYTRYGLENGKFVIMSEIQRASLPHSLCGRDVLGAAKTGSGKTLAFVVPVLEKLYRARWGPEDGVGSIIISPTRELAVQLFEVLKSVGKYHSLSAGLLIGGAAGVDVEKQRVNDMNILVCTPGRLLQHMNETPNFDCSQLQILVLDEADRILDTGFKRDLNAIISQLPRQRQTLLFSATQKKSVKDLARLSLKDPEYISVHEESVTATPDRLLQLVMIVPLDKKLDMLWSFVKSNLNSKILVFLSTCKQVRFVSEAFMKLRPGIPVNCLHGRMNQNRRMATFSSYCEQERAILFCTDIASRGLDFPAIQWVVQMDCPEDVAAYIHRVGRTARFTAGGRSLLFLMPSEKNMISSLEAAKIPTKIKKANSQRVKSVSGELASVLVKFPLLRLLAEKAILTYLKSLKRQVGKDEFDFNTLPINELAASYGLAAAPKCRFLNLRPHKKENGINIENQPTHRSDAHITFDEEDEGEILLPKQKSVEIEPNAATAPGLATRILKKKKLKINISRPIGQRFVFDEEGNALPPLAAAAGGGIIEDSVIEPDKVKERFQKLKEEIKIRDREDKLLLTQRLRDKRLNEKAKHRKQILDENDSNENDSGLDVGIDGAKDAAKRSKICFNSDSSDEGEDRKDVEYGNGSKKKSLNLNSITVAEQEALALKLLDSLG